MLKKLYVKLSRFFRSTNTQSVKKKNNIKNKNSKKKLDDFNYTMF